MSTRFIKSSDFPLRTEVRSFQARGEEDYETYKGDDDDNRLDGT